MRSRNCRLAPRALPWLALCATLCATGCQWDSSVYDAVAKNNGYVVACSPTVLSEDGRDYINVGELKCYEDSVEYSKQKCDKLNISIDSNENVSCACPENDDTCISFEFPENSSTLIEQCKQFQTYWNDIKENSDRPQSCENVDGDCTSRKYVSLVNDSDNLSDYSNIMDGQNLKICPKDYPICNVKKDGSDLIFSCQKIKCLDGQVYCGGKCVDPNSDVTFCGNNYDMYRRRNHLRVRAKMHGWIVYCFLSF